MKHKKSRCANGLKTDSIVKCLSGLNNIGRDKSKRHPIL